MAYFKGKFALGLKGRFNTNLFFMSKGKIHVHANAYSYIKGKFYAMDCFVAGL